MEGLRRSARKAKGDGHLRRTEILEAAQRIFIEQGYQGATIRRIAEEVGVSSTALYMHFKDKHAIFIEISRLQFDALLAINAKLLQERLDPIVRVRRMLQGYFVFALANPNVYRLVYCSPPEVERADALIAMGRNVYLSFREGVLAVRDAGKLRLDDVDVAAQTAWAACHGLVSLLLTRPWFSWSDLSALEEAMLDSVTSGLARP